MWHGFAESEIGFDAGSRGRRNFAAADAAYAELAKAFENQRTPFDRPDLGDRRPTALKALRESLDVIRKRLSQD